MKELTKILVEQARTLGINSCFVKPMAFQIHFEQHYAGTCCVGRNIVHTIESR